MYYYATNDPTDGTTAGEVLEGAPLQEQLLNETIDFSFELQWKDTGDWSNWRDYIVDVSNSKRDMIPEKEAEKFGDKFASLSNRMKRDKGLL
jgi:hypothetical protein